MQTYTAEEKTGPFQFLMLVLSLYVLSALVADTFFTLPSEVSKVLNLVDHFICLFFLADFIIRFRQAGNKWVFMRWGWIDLVSSIPTIDALRTGRIFRIIRLIRILRALRSTKTLVHFIFRNRKKGTMTAVALISVMLIIFSSISILLVEQPLDNSNIKNAEDALWWSFVTITTVGYGDKFRVTTEGRLIGGLLMICGVGLFGTFTGFIASWFVEGNKLIQRKQSKVKILNSGE